MDAATETGGRNVVAVLATAEDTFGMELSEPVPDPLPGFEPLPEFDSLPPDGTVEAGPGTTGECVSPTAGPATGAAVVSTVAGDTALTATKLGVGFPGGGADVVVTAVGRGGSDNQSRANAGP